MHEVDKFSSFSQNILGREILFELRNLSYVYADGTEAVKDLNLKIYRRDRIALVGRNGSGKTTLGKLMAGIYSPSKGDMIYYGSNKESLSIGMIFQEVDDQLFCPTLFEDIAFGLLNKGLDPEKSTMQIKRFAESLGVEPYLYKEPHNMSYGQRKRAAFAAVAALEPDILILDEPTVGLDEESEKIIIEVLERFRGTVICISHDIFFLYTICHRAVVLQNGCLHHDFTMADLVSDRDYLKDHGLDFTFRFNCCDPYREYDRDRRDGNDSPPIIADPLISMTDYSYSYPDGTWGIKHITMEINRGEKLALVGENGAGKSTLALCLAGVFKGEGKYTFAGIPISHRNAGQLWKRIGLVFQDSRDQLFCSSCFEEIAFGLRRLGYNETTIKDKVAQVLEMVKLKGYEKKVPYHLSGGEQKRLALAAVISMDPEVIILDEPTNNLDPEGEEILIEVLSSFESNTIIIISHDVCFLSFLCDRAMVMHGKSIVKDMTFESFFMTEISDLRKKHKHKFRHHCCEEIRKLFYGIYQ